MNNHDYSKPTLLYDWQDRDLDKEPCWTCRNFGWHLTNLKGSIRTSIGGTEVALDEDFWMPACKSCGEMLLSLGECEALEAAVQRALDNIEDKT